MESIGNIISSIYSFIVNSNTNFDNNRIKTNYDCEVCRCSGRPPNMLGRFIKINELQEKCNGCGTTYHIVQAAQVSTIPVAQCVMIRD